MGDSMIDDSIIQCLNCYSMITYQSKSYCLKKRLRHNVSNGLGGKLVNNVNLRMKTMKMCECEWGGIRKYEVSGVELDMITQLLGLAASTFKASIRRNRLITCS